MSSKRVPTRILFSWEISLNYRRSTAYPIVIVSSCQVVAEQQSKLLLFTQIRMLFSSESDLHTYRALVA